MQRSSNIFQFESVVSKEWLVVVVVYELLHNKQVARELNRILFRVFRNLGESVFQMKTSWHIFHMQMCRMLFTNS